MPMTIEEKKTWEQQAFGCAQEALNESKPGFVSNLMYAMMILSDAQHEILFGNNETGRLYINRAKHFIDAEMHKG